MSDRTAAILTKVVAVVIALRALTNVGKPFGAGRGLVFFGNLLTGTPNLILAPTLGILMLVLAYGMWVNASWALPASIVYAVFVTLNVPLFVVFEGIPAQFSVWQYALFGLVAIGGAWLAPWSLSLQRQAVPR